MVAPVTLRYTQHDRDSAGRLYVYPVLSRRAGGISLGINLNVNNACNWACIYCQVPDLVRGGPDPIEIPRLCAEFESLLRDILSGEVFTADAPPEQRKLVDVAFSGNGEPTSAAEFPEVVRAVYAILDAVMPGHQLPVRLITNGSLLHRPAVQEGIRMIGSREGEVWFKVDRMTASSVQHVNGVPLQVDKVRQNLRTCVGLAQTWVQTCWLAVDGKAPDEADQAAYLSLISEFRHEVAGVLLYGMARDSANPLAAHLSRLSADVLEAFASRIRHETGVEVRVSP